MLSPNQVYEVFPPARGRNQNVYKHTYYRIRYRDGDTTKVINPNLVNHHEAVRYAQELESKGFFNLSPLFGAYARGFYDEASPYVKERALRGKPLGEQYRIGLASNLNVLLKEFKGVTLKELTADYLDSWFMAQKEAGKSTSTLNNYKKTLAPVFEKATDKDHLLPKNPLDAIQSLGVIEVTKKAFSNYKIHHLLGQKPWVKNELAYYLSLTSASMGGRIGELQGLQCKHIEPENFTADHPLLWVQIEQTYQQATGLIGPPKAESYRTVPFMHKVASVWLYNRVKSLRAALGDDYKQAYIFSDDGTLEGVIDQTKANRALAGMYKKVSELEALPKEYSFHSLRRWFNTRALVLTGHNEYLVKKLMGHREKGNMTDRYNTVSKDTYRIWIDEHQGALFGTIEAGVHEFCKETAKVEIPLDDAFEDD